MNHDILQINQTQARIIKTMLRKLLPYIKTQEVIPMIPDGVTSYDLEKGKRDESVANSTWHKHRKHLEKDQLIARVNRPKKRRWKKKRTRVVHPYTVTPLGLFAYLKSIANENISSNLEKPILEQFVPLIGNHWNELKRIGEKTTRFKKNYENVMWFILKSSIEKIEITRDTEQKIFLGRTLQETTRLPIDFTGELVVKRSYQSFSKKQLQQLNQLQSQMKEKLEELYLPNYSQLTYDVVKRITFIFYYLTMYLLGNPIHTAELDIIIKKISDPITRKDFRDLADQYKIPLSDFHKGIRNFASRTTNEILKDKNLVELIEDHIREFDPYLVRPGIFDYFEESSQLKKFEPKFLKLFKKINKRK